MLVFLTEEPSMATLLDDLLPRLFPGLSFRSVPHEGKNDLKRSAPRKLRAWGTEARFIVLIDNDGGDCIARKQEIAKLCADAGRPDTLVRIVCQELEAWYLGAPAALAATLEKTGTTHPPATTRCWRALNDCWPPPSPSSSPPVR